MKTVKLYKVVSEDVLVGDFDKVIQYRLLMSLDNFRNIGDSIIISSPITFHECPIYQWRKIECGEEKGGFVAMEPELRKLLEEPFDAYANKSITEAWQETNRVRKEANDYSYRILVHNNLPWYKRIFRKV